MIKSLTSIVTSGDADQPRVTQVAPFAKKDLVDIGLLLRGEFTLPSFLNILENWSQISSIPYKHETNNNVHDFIIQHDMGRNFSFLIKELYRYILEDMFEKKSDFTITENTVMFRFREG